MGLPVDTAKFRFRENGRRIRAARRLTGLSQENFAPLIGTGRRHMIKLENGEHRPSGTLRDRIVQVTGTQEQIEASDDEDEEALLRELMDRVDVPEHWMSIEGRREWMYPNATQADVQSLRDRALRDIKSSFELEATL